MVDNFPVHIPLNVEKKYDWLDSSTHVLLISLEYDESSIVNCWVTASNHLLSSDTSKTQVSLKQKFFSLGKCWIFVNNAGASGQNGPSTEQTIGDLCWKKSRGAHDYLVSKYLKFKNITYGFWFFIGLVCGTYSTWANLGYLMYFGFVYLPIHQSWTQDIDVPF